MDATDEAGDFARELATYERHRAVLEREHKDGIALLRGDDLIGVFPTLQAAGDEGYRRFGALPFLIKEVSDPVHFMPYAVFPDGPAPAAISG